MSKMHILSLGVILYVSAFAIASAQTSSNSPSQAACQSAKVSGIAHSGAIVNSNSTNQLTGNGQPGTGGQFNSGGTTSGYNGIGSKTTPNGTSTSNVTTGQAPVPNCP